MSQMLMDQTGELNQRMLILRAKKDQEEVLRAQIEAEENRREKRDIQKDRLWQLRELDKQLEQQIEGLVKGQVEREGGGEKEKQEGQ